MIAALALTTALLVGIGCSHYRGAAGELSYEGVPLTENTIEHERVRLAIVLRPLYTTRTDKFMGITVGTREYRVAEQAIAFIVQAKSESVDVDFAALRLSADCEADMSPRVVRRVEPSRSAASADAFGEWRRREEGRQAYGTTDGTISYAYDGPRPLPDQPLDAVPGVSLAPGELVLFELVYELPECYAALGEMRLVIGGIRVGQADAPPLVVDISKHETQLSVED